MTTPIRIRNNSADHYLDVDEIQISNDEREIEHHSTYRMKPGEEYVVYVYRYRFFQLKEGPKLGEDNGMALGG